jgi:hypothetical protein
MDETGFWQQVFHDAGGELAVAAVYLLAWLFCAWLPDTVLLGLMVGIGLQYFVVTVVLAAITPRGFVAITVCVLGHAALFALMLWAASAGGKQPPDLVAVALAQGPLLIRTISRLWLPKNTPRFMFMEAIGAWLLLMPVIIVTAVLIAILPDSGLAPREPTFRHYPPLTAHDLGFGLLGGAVYFTLYAVGRTLMQRLGGDEHARAELSQATIRRWREDYLRSRGQR